MAGKITVKTVITIVDDSTSAPETIELAPASYSFTAIERKRYALTASATQSIWDPATDATEAASTFSFLLLNADGNVDVEMTPDGSGNAFTQRIVANLPLMLGADDSYRTTGFSGVLGLITKLRLKEPAGTARTVQVILAS